MLILTPAWCPNDTILTAHGKWTMLSFPKIGNIVFRLGATCKIKYHRMRCKEMLNCFLCGAKCVHE